MDDHLSLAGTPLKYFHICAFFNSRDEEFDVLTPFYKEGLEQNEKEMHIVDPAFLEEHRARLAAGGINCAHCEQTGQLQLIPWDQAYLDDRGVFDKERMLAVVDELTGSGRDAGYKRLRIMGNMAWAFRDTPGASKIIEYEAEVNEVLSRNRQPAVCVYDVANLSGTMMIDLLRTHPLTLIGGVVQENPYFTPPAEMLAELRGRERRAATAATA